MTNPIQKKFADLATENAPGQEVRQAGTAAGSGLIGETLAGRPVDFSHGDVDAFLPSDGALETFVEGYRRGGSQAYTEYLGDASIRAGVAQRLGDFTGAALTSGEDLIITPGTQGALFLAMGATVTRGTKVAIVEPDYFANRKLVRFFDGVLVPIAMDYLDTQGRAGLNLDRLEAAFKDGAEVLVLSNPNNPTGVIYSPAEIDAIATLAGRYGATVIVDQLYSRLLYEGQAYTHLRATAMPRENLITIMGPSKTESLSGFRLGVAFGSEAIIERMAKLQAIVSLRAGGYSQAVLKLWLAEPEAWMAERIVKHQAIRDDLIAILRRIDGVRVRTPEAGSYLFPQLPKLTIGALDFVRALRLQAGVTVTPGTEFGPGSFQSIRFNYSQDHAAAVAAAERTVALIERYRAGA
ncbi:pyridoxal phosphate-dependent aminotransferase [Bosea sp. (in: a-proteobacteria)]|uniref:pyridoxal phosphate-dependent aminotransferase n=1 Tax=Bosea sp. (in: a-proteobacteria) TaxID=1871050 RepID=UPI00261CDDBA|nr:pyridoxal phosphate-dependent aminotransferase [Bosea sp. (in: a-proteobacteria)]MCO5093538.1 pyridoxal phosphate-dependent aminotransferase [Bosea sp. (in: a-proteobacteria)]